MTRHFTITPVRFGFLSHECILEFSVTITTHSCQWKNKKARIRVSRITCWYEAFFVIGSFAINNFTAKRQTALRIINLKSF